MKNWQFITLLLITITGFAYLGYKINKIDTLNDNVIKNFTGIILNASELTHIRETTDTTLNGITDIRNFIETN